MGTLGSFLGPGDLLVVLFATVLVAGAMGLVLVIWEGRVRQTLRNMAGMLAALLTFHAPGPELSLDNPEALKVPFGVAVAIAVVLYSARHAWGLFS